MLAPSIEVPFTSTEWTAAELNGQIVEFHLTYPEEKGMILRANGVGKFMVLAEREKKMRLIIDITNVDWIKATMEQTQHPLLQRHVDKIERHPEAHSGEKHQAQFRVNE